MTYSLIRNEESLKAQMEDAGIELPVAKDASVLTKPLKIGSRTAANRLAYQPMEGCDGTPDGIPDELTVRRYVRFAHGGPGLIWFEATAVMREGRANPRQMFLDEKNLDAFKKFVEGIREESVKTTGIDPIIICQLTHSGRYSKPNGVPEPLVAYLNPLFEKDKPLDPDRIVSDDYLDRVGEALINGARLAEKAGFDGADIKSCHRYLLSELLSAYERPGKYGGSYENRTRLLRETFGSAMSGAGKDFIITSRLNVYDGFPYPYGFGVDPGEDLKPNWTEGTRLISDLSSLGAKLLDVTMGNPYVNPHVNRPYVRGPYEAPEHPLFGVQRMLTGTREVRKNAPNTAIICSGLSYLGAMGPRVAAAGIESGWFEMAGFGRQTLAYPDLALDITEKGGLVPEKLCMACSKCTEIMRQPGGTPGCVVRDSGVYAPLYRKLVLGQNK
ncbi:MAG: flavin oxidoreductase/NADH oxidase [Clostridia bacterium]|nr:flavin oxidoreductase/NADH oxidase [Clostridia bacterium]